MKILFILMFLASCGMMGSRPERKKCPEGERWNWKEKMCKPLVYVGVPNAS